MSHFPARPLPSRRRASLRRAGVIAAAAAGALLLVPAAGATTTATTGGSYNGLALTPPMGFNDWNAFGCNVSAQLIEQTALAMHNDGMQAAGYDYVNIDDCWINGRSITDPAAKLAAGRDAKGHLVADPTYFPGGIKPVADYVHSLGMKLGIYEDIGTATCQGLAGSYGHYPQDAKDFASWGVDYLKFDDCNLPAAIPATPAGFKKAYTQMSKALLATGRPIVFSMCENTTKGQSWLWGGAISNLWRTTGDIRPNFASMVSNFTANSALAQYAGPGHWNDPDMLEIGTGTMTNLAAPAAVGDTTIKVDSVSSAIPGSPITVGTKAGHDLESSTVASVGTAATNTKLFAPASAGATNVSVSNVNGFSVGDPFTVGGTNAGTITSVGTAGGTSTLFADAAAGDTNVKLPNLAGVTVGQPITIGTGGAAESPTVTSIGTPAVATSLAAATAVGDTTIKVQSVNGVNVGDALLIDSGANAETVTVTSVGTAGPTGTGLGVSPALQNAHSGGFRGAAVKDESQPGTGVTFSPALQYAHPAGTATSANGTGITFSRALPFAEPVGAIAVGQTGTGITLTKPLTKAHATGAGVGVSGMTLTEERSELSLWAMESAPLIAGTDIVNMATQNRKIYENKAVIAVDQDKLGNQASVISNANSQWVLAKQLTGNARAVALFNAGSTAWSHITVSLASLGLKSGTAYTATDLWTGKQRAVTDTLNVGSVAPHATTILRFVKATS